MKRETKKLTDFSGGLNNRFSSAVIADNQASDLQNVWGDDTAPISCQPTGVLQSILPEGTAGAGQWTLKSSGGASYLITANKNGTSSMVYTSTDGIIHTAMTDSTINTTVALAISSGSQTVTPLNMANITTNSWLIIDTGAVQERVKVTGITATTFTATFLNAHATLPVSVIGNVLFLNSAFVPEGVTFKGIFILSDGNTTPLVFDGTNWWNMGSALIVPRVDATGVQLGNGTYKYTFSYTSAIDSLEYFFNIDSNTVTNDVAHTSNQLLNIPLGLLNGGTTKRTVYRTKVNGSTYFKLQDISDNSTQSLIDTTPDASLGAAIPTMTNVVTPPKGYHPVIHQDRLWMIKTTAQPFTDFYSGVDTPFIFPALNFIQIPGGAEIVWGAFSFVGTLITATENNIWVTSGDGVNQNFSTDRRVTGIGSVFHRSFATYFVGEQQLLIFLSKNGWYSYDGSTNPTRISDSIQGTFNTIQQPNVVFNSYLAATQSNFNAGTYTANVGYSTALSGVALNVDAGLSAAAHNFNFINCQSNFSATAGGRGIGPRSNGPFSIPTNGNAWGFSATSSTFFPNATTGTAITPPVTTYGPVASLLQTSPIAVFSRNGDAQIDMYQSFTPVLADTLLFTHVEWTTPAASTGFGLVYYQITILDNNGNVVTTVPITQNTNTSNNSSAALAGVVTQTINFTKANIASVHMSAHVTEPTGPAAIDWYAFLITNMQYKITQYKPSGSWTSPVIDSVAGYKLWQTFTSANTLNGQSINYFIDSSVGTTPPPGPFIAIKNGAQIIQPATDRYVQLRADLSLTANTLNLPSQSATAQTYNGSYLPNAPITGTTPYPFAITSTSGSPGFSIISNALNFNLPKASAITVSRNATAVTNYTALNNAAGWTAEMGYSVSSVGGNFIFQASDGSVGIQAQITNANIKLRDTSGGGLNTNYAFNNTDGNNHVIRFTVIGTSLNVYLDNLLTPIVTGTLIVYAANNEILINPAGSGSIGTNVTVNYASWDNATIDVPVAADNTSSPILSNIFFSWFSNPTGIIPNTTVAAINYKNRYWCSVTELKNPIQSYNNVVCIFDLRQAWVLKRAINIGAMTLFNGSLWWVTSTIVAPSQGSLPGIYRMSPFPAAIVTPNFVGGAISTANIVDYQYYRTKKMNFGFDGIKEFKDILVRYNILQVISIGARQVIKIRAFVDDKFCQSWWLSPTQITAKQNVIETSVAFPNNGTQIGGHLMLEITNAVYGGVGVGNTQLGLDTVLLPYEIYDIEVSMIVHDGRIQPSLAQIAPLSVS